MVWKWEIIGHNLKTDYLNFLFHAAQTRRDINVSGYHLYFDEDIESPYENVDKIKTKTV